MNPLKIDRSNRLTDAAVAVLQGAGGSLKITVVQKALFFADLIALRDLGEAITGATYMALERGPVVAKYKQRLVGGMASRGFAAQTLEGSSMPLALTEVGATRPTFPGLMGSILRERGERFAQRSSANASDLSHDNPGWQMAWEAGGKRGASRKPINMLIALQDHRLYTGGEIDDLGDLNPELLRDIEAAERGEYTDWA